MGMDGVEIVMAVEDQFGITIEDAEAEHIRTPGQLIDLVSSKLACAPIALCRTRRAFHVVRRVFQKRFTIERRSISPDTKLGNIVPKLDRIHIWKSLQHEFGATTWPELHYPYACSLGILGFGVLSIYVAEQYAKSAFLSWAVGISLFVLLWKFLKSLRTSFLGRVQTVAELARFLAGQSPALFEPSQAWSQIEVAREVRRIVIDVLCCDNYRENADFVAPRQIRL